MKFLEVKFRLKPVSLSHKNITESALSREMFGNSKYGC